MDLVDLQVEEGVFLVATTVICIQQVIKKLKRLEFEFDRLTNGSHEIWFNPTTNQYTTTPNHPGDIPEGTLRAILRQSSVTTEQFLRA